ncbi:methyltransferase domain-containing protein [Actinosynnema sp. NPDC023587]|uniref:class I SAM-dependent methyltransferase n=1 Tax=Actinosynnema sp. NPDC023587 TaxID=3154695 RepID=UPI0033CBEF7F
MTAVPDDASRQRRYHDHMFASLGAWEHTGEVIRDFTGELTVTGVMGLDQMGHFGPHGCDLVGAEILATDRPALTVLELGTGFGGVIRYLADLLRRHGRVVTALGADLVPEHVAGAARIDRALAEHPTRYLCADVSRLPLRDNTVDVVVVCGSLPHFRDPTAVFTDAHRVLAPGGLLVATDEVGMLRSRANAPAPEFFRRHPPDVFFQTTPAERREQLTDAGFRDVGITELLPWAPDVIAARLEALRLFSGSAENIYGTQPVAAIQQVLSAAAVEYAEDRIVPGLLLARP